MFELCAQADNGHDTLLLASKLQPDVIFIDIRMPGLNGLEAAMQLNNYCQAILIFVTAFAGTRSMTKCFLISDLSVHKLAD